MRFQAVSVFVRRTRRAILRQVMVGLAACILVGAHTSTAKAESLSSALVAAYVTNPTLNAARARLRAIDEEASQARSNLRPSLTGDLETGYRKINPKLKGGATAPGAGTHHPGKKVCVSGTPLDGADVCRRRRLCLFHPDTTADRYIDILIGGQ